MASGKYTEIFRLRDMLDEAGIPYDFSDRSFRYQWSVDHVVRIGAGHELYQIFYPSRMEWMRRGKICSIIEGDGTYGNSDDLLEIMGLLTDEERENDDVKGYLSAEEVFMRIKSCEENRIGNSGTETEQ